MQFANSHNGAFYVGLAGNTSGDAILHSADGTAGMAFGTNNTERMRIDSSGNVQIGTGTPAYLVGTSDIAQLSVNRVGTSGAITNASRSAAFINVNGADGGSSIEFSTASANNTQPSEVMRIDSAGNVGIGETNPKAPGGSDARSLTLKGISYPQIITVATGATANSTTWRSISRSTHVYQIQTVNDAVTDEQTAYEISRGSGLLSISYQRWFAGTAEAMRINSAGNLLVGGTADRGGRICVGGTSSTARILPQTDNVGYIGQSDFRWQAVYATNGTIQTSDEREKTAIKPTTLGLEFIKDLRPVSYKWIDGEQQNKGKDEREHQGLIAQQVAETVEKHGIDKNLFGGLDIQKSSKYKDSHGMVYDQLIAPLIKAIQEQQTLIESLTARIAALEE